MIARGVGLRRTPLLVAPLLTLALVLSPAAAPLAAAASDGLSLTTLTTYTVVPAKGVVHVVVDVDALNQKPDLVSGGVRTRYFYDGFRLGIQSEARSIGASSGGRNLALRSSPASGYTQIDVRFLRSLFHGQSETVRVTFDLPGGKPRSKSAIRVDPAFATFEAWAFGDSGSVRVVVPVAFDTTTRGADMARSTSGRNAVFTASGITDVPSWYAVISADRPAALTTRRIDLPDGEHVVVHAWPDDPTWSKDVTSLLTDGLPELVRQTGLDWPVTDDLDVFEVHTPLLEGYAGVFFENENRIEISEDLDDLTILHEASHAWFNGALFDGRWINEGFADTFASRSLDELGLGHWAPADVRPTDAAAVKLNEWLFPGRITNEQTDAREQFGYDAAWTVVRSLVDDIGEGGMRDVLAAAEHGDIAYVGSGAAEHVTGPTDWRRLLDLVDERGHAAGADELFRRWVVTDADLGTLNARASERAAYARLRDDAGDWAMPIAIRKPMSDWDFTAAGAGIARAETVLLYRNAIAGLATGLGVTPPTDLRSAFEHAGGSLDEALRIGATELNRLRAVKIAADAVAAPRAPLVVLGLLGTDPAARLQAVLAAFSAGSPTAGSDATALVATIDGAAQVGRERLLVALAMLAILVVALAAVAVLRWRVVRRRRGARPALESVEAPAIEPLPVVEAPAIEPLPIVDTASATLADQSAVAPDETPRPPAATGDAS